MRRPSLAGLGSRLGAAVRGGPLQIASLVLSVLVLIAAALAIWFTVDWYQAEHDDDIELAETRDEVLRDAQQAAVNLVTLDYKRVEEGLDLWEQSSTGDTLKEFQTNRKVYVDTITAAKRTTVGEFVDGAVTELDDRSGTARAIVGVNVSVTPEGQPPTEVRQRLQLQLSRDGDTWKVSAIAPVGEAGQPVVPN